MPLPIIQRARAMRKAMTPQELTLWRHLRAMRADGWRFRRQAPEGKYILDFVCREAALVVEVDGYHHEQDVRQLTHDAVRDDVLRKMGFFVLRFTNQDIDHALGDVLAKIGDALRAIDPTRRPAGDTLPLQGRERGQRYQRLVRMGLRRQLSARD